MGSLQDNLFKVKNQRSPHKSLSKPKGQQSLQKKLFIPKNQPSLQDKLFKVKNQPSLQEKLFKVKDQLPQRSQASELSKLKRDLNSENLNLTNYEKKKLI